MSNPIKTLAGAVRGVTQHFEDLEQFAAHLTKAAAHAEENNREALKEAAEIIKKDAEQQIGHYQDAVGNYPEWAPLAESTEDEKARLGYEPDAPLLREGDLRNSFRRSMDGDDAVVIGSTDPVMEYHEFGTDKMPPRPVLGPAVLKHMDQIQERLGAGIVATVVGQRLGYKVGTGGIGDSEGEAE